MLHPHDSYLSDDTICAISTALGGAIAIVRVSGDQAFESLGKLLQSTEGLAKDSEPRKFYRAFLPFDDALFVRFVKPHSYTGEDMVEYHLHGGYFIAHKLIEALLGLGIRQALPGEFSFRAVRNGKLSLYQAQAVADLIAASNSGAVSLALDKLSGRQNQGLEEISSGLRTLAALSEVGIDFADQDVDEVSLPNLKKKLSRIKILLTQLSESYQRGIKIQEGHKVTFVGAPNSGKSSFFNALLGEDRSIVSDIPGTTRDVVREKLTLRGNKNDITLRLEDTAGLRDTLDSIEREGIQRTERSAEESDLILFIVDSTVSNKVPALLWASLVDKLGVGAQLHKKTIGIVTKCDLVSKGEIAKNLEFLEELKISARITTSALTGAGITDAANKIVEFCETQTHRQRGEILLTRLEHLNAVKHALEHIERAEAAVELDLFASDVRQTLIALNCLVGETLPDDILGMIFSQFCIGK